MTDNTSKSPVPGGMVPGDYSNAPPDKPAKLEIAYGRRTYPDGVKAVYGARLIWPNDLVPDRQDLAAQPGQPGETAKIELMTWLNGEAGDGALHEALLRLANPYALGLLSNGDNEAVIYEDKFGKIIGSAQKSYGYLYVCGWMFKHEDAL